MKRNMLPDNQLLMFTARHPKAEWRINHADRLVRECMQDRHELARYARKRLVHITRNHWGPQFHVVYSRTGNVDIGTYTVGRGQRAYFYSLQEVIDWCESKHLAIQNLQQTIDDEQRMK